MQRRNVPTGNDKRTPAQKMAKNMTIFAFVTCLLVIGVIYVFYQHKNADKVESGNMPSATELQKLTEKDLEMGYPETPTEVVKFFARINQYIYNTGGLDDETFDKLLNQLRMLYSKSLLDQNTFEEQKENFIAEVQEFQKKKRKIANYTVDKESSLKYLDYDGQKCALIQISFFMTENGNYSKVFQDYILVKEEKHWKILAFKKNVNSNQEKSES
ncbi:MAG: hypothetical protein HFG36_10330 [Eubacterium sp.]|nr:hypothetical protein [Eubacterium sp.]